MRTTEQESINPQEQGMVMIDGDTKRKWEKDLGIKLEGDTALSSTNIGTVIEIALTTGIVDGVKPADKGAENGDFNVVARGDELPVYITLSDNNKGNTLNDRFQAIEKDGKIFVDADKNFLDDIGREFVSAYQEEKPNIKKVISAVLQSKSMPNDELPEMLN